MKILFTGASSFTGMWFLKELREANHNVTATFLRAKDAYEGLRRSRVEQCLPLCKAVFDIPFGSDKFLDVIETMGPWDMLCHHAAEVRDYKSPDFDPAAALASNTRNLKSVLETLQKNHCSRILLSGSVFEQNEGRGNDGLKAVSPYGLSKGLTAEVFRFYAERLGLHLGKLVIPNPFGPYEEYRFTSFLVDTWSQRKKAFVSQPDYVRDNIPVTLLAKSYAHFADKLLNKDAPGFQKLNPSCYAGPQGDFVSLFAKEMRRRLDLPCEFTLGKQTSFPEPKVRCNTDPLDWKIIGWEEAAAWDSLAEFYRKTYLSRDKAHA